MTENKFWSFFGIALAVMAFFHKNMSTQELLLLGALVVIVCFVISYIWNKLLNSNHKWIDAVCYFFSKSKSPYIIVDKIVRYNITTPKEAIYDLSCKLKVKKDTPRFCYKGRYHWDQEEDIAVSVTGDGKFKYETSEDLKWSNVDIFPEDRIIHRNDVIKCGFSLNNLHISRLNKHSYLSCKMIEKTKNLKMIALVNSGLKPLKEAVFITQNSFGDEIDREKLLYNDISNCYEKTIVYPRRGRKYIIKWEYEK